MATNHSGIVISGIGVVSSLGTHLDAHRHPIQTPPAPKPLQHAVEAATTTQVAFAIDRLKPHPFMKRRKDLKLMSRDAWIALVAAAHALEHANLPPDQRDAWPVSSHDIGLFMGVGFEVGETRDLLRALSVSSPDPDDPSIDLTQLAQRGLDLIPPLSALKTLPNMALAHVSINLDIMGPGESFTPHTTSGLHALEAAAESIALRECPIALVGAADSDLALAQLLTQSTQGTLMEIQAHELATLSLPADRTGAIPGEGGAFLVLEPENHAQNRNATTYGTLVATGNYASPQLSPGLPSSEHASHAMHELLQSVPDNADLLVAGHCAHSLPDRAHELAALLAQPPRSGKTDLVWPSTHFGDCASATALMNLASLLTSSTHSHVASFAHTPSGDIAWAVVALSSPPSQTPSTP